MDRNENRLKFEADSHCEVGRMCCTSASPSVYTPAPAGTPLVYICFEAVKEGCRNIGNHFPTNSLYRVHIAPVTRIDVDHQFGPVK